jgi:hypothetical protein
LGDEIAWMGWVWLNALTHPINEGIYGIVVIDFIVPYSLGYLILTNDLPLALVEHFQELKFFDGEGGNEGLSIEDDGFRLAIYADVFLPRP